MKFFILFSTTVILFSSVNLAYSQKKKALDYLVVGSVPSFFKPIKNKKIVGLLCLVCD
jgi:hypothetical protein